MLTGHPLAWTPSALNILLRLTTGVGLFVSAIYLFRLMSPWPIIGIALVGAALVALLAVGGLLDILPFESLIGGLLDANQSTRAGGAFSDPNFLGLYMATATILAMGLFGQRPPWVKAIAVALVILFLACARPCPSREERTWGIAAGVVVLVWLRESLAALALLVAGAVLVVEPLSRVPRGAPRAASLSPTRRAIDLARAKARERRWRPAASRCSRPIPVFGVGFGMFQFVSPSYITGRRAGHDLSRTTSTSASSPSRGSSVS